MRLYSLGALTWRFGDYRSESHKILGGHSCNDYEKKIPWTKAGRLSIFSYYRVLYSEFSERNGNCTETIVQNLTNFEGDIRTEEEHKKFALSRFWKRGRKKFHHPGTNWILFFKPNKSRKYDRTHDAARVRPWNPHMVIFKWDFQTSLFFGLQSVK